MRKIFIALFALLVGCSKCSTTNAEELIEVNFSPNGGVETAIIREINASKTSINIQAYSFTNPKIGEALLAAHSRGVKVEVILDRENLGNPHSLIKDLSSAGVPIFIDAAHQIAHNKIMIFDGKTVETGSYNFTRSAEEKNAENSLIIKDSRLASRYIINWNTHKSHSKPFQPKE